MGTTAGSGAAWVQSRRADTDDRLPGVKRAPLVLPAAAKIEGGGHGCKHGDRGCSNIARWYAL